MPDVRDYAREMHEVLRTRDPAAYRDFVNRWRDLHQRGAAERLLATDERALRVRMEHMILDQPALADLHEAARSFLEEHYQVVRARQKEAKTDATE
jgi:hypothetical protein